ncbi:DUF5655 domain-containing protein [Pontibacter sp. HSC-36F09]|uniref:DUF5655 domain-containing protein n=1 Tax=Pontibacter sp. HSC-36F09 TaxID=2910966 RepID=UPI0020A0909D|nr:DUF5655 domain-containing protein [Pontibacter sp. HSC-36F09]MCP2043913.1 hypothetical protein [Pontibacter sp. HSC-36F09]
MADKTEDAILEFFKGRESSLKLFRLLRRVIERNCSPEIKVSKTQISFGEIYKYIWVWLPQVWVANRPEGSLVLTIVTGGSLTSDRIVESVQPKKGYWTHHIIIENEKDIDTQIEDLIKKSYDFYTERLDHKKQQRAKKKTRE